ncbi:MAG TPA: MGMT family protein [Candidatus Krumholzibacteria bacterium]|nr:MGMT family protein [Candidatus Krumholzibacteria bacterium]
MVKSRHIAAVVRRIPRGRVATYGQVAALAGLPGHARLVGYTLHALPDNSPVPWHRVINTRGEVSPRGERGAELLQRALLEGEGVVFDARGRVALDRFAWRGRTLAVKPRAAPRRRAAASRRRASPAPKRR